MAALPKDLLHEILLREAKGLARGAQGLPAILKQKVQELDDNFRAKIDPTWAFKVVANRCGYVPSEVYGWVEKVDFGKLPGEVLQKVSTTSLNFESSTISAYRIRAEDEEEGEGVEREGQEARREQAGTRLHTTTSVLQTKQPHKDCSSSQPCKS